MGLITIKDSGFMEERKQWPGHVMAKLALKCPMNIGLAEGWNGVPSVINCGNLQLFF